MMIEDPRDYLGKKVTVFDADGDVTEGVFDNYGYDFDDAGVEILEFDIERADGALIGFTEAEIDHIEVVGED